jgi:hypothetical protein
VGRSPQHTLKVGTVSEAWNATSQSLQALRGRSPSPRRHLESLEIARGDTGFVKARWAVVPRPASRMARRSVTDVAGCGAARAVLHTRHRCRSSATDTPTSRSRR